ncbi:MAG: helix-turn-helix domain-containing protein [Cyclobacteriaceae bacterium]
MKNRYQFKTRSQLAHEYGVSRRTLYNMFKKAGLVLPDNQLISPAKVEEIYLKFGKPE